MTENVFLVTGAHGCIGSWVVRELAAAGQQVVAADVGQNRSRLELVTDGVDLTTVAWSALDVTDADAVRRALDDHGVTNVIHLAALQVPFCRADPVAGALVNVVGTVNVFQAACERRDRVRNVVYASSVGMFDTADADPSTMQLAADAVAHPRSHYGVYKLANEGTARVYWSDNGVPSAGLRPFVVYGPGRDQGLTSSPTAAMLAAALGRPHHISYGGRIQMQFAPDAAHAFIAASQRVTSGAHLANLGGPVADVNDIIAILAELRPESRGAITATNEPLPFPASVDTTSLVDLLGLVRDTPLHEGVQRTLDHFAAAIERGWAVPAPL